MSNLQGGPTPPCKNICVLCGTPGCVFLLTPWYTWSFGQINNPHCLWGSVSGGCQIISRKSRERKTSLHLHPLKSLKTCRVNWSRIFLYQFPDSYQPEALRVLGVLRVHGLESNISKNKQNWGQILSLTIWHNWVLYCTKKIRRRYDQIHSYYMICALNTKVFFSNCHMIHMYF